jgi:hypothetical protein
MKAVRGAPLSCVILLGLVGCGDRAPPAPSAVVSDSAGVEIVSNGPASVVLEAREVLRLGVLDGGGPEQFSEVYAVELSADGRTFVANNGSGTVRVFDDAGRFVVEFGGHGEGPGEVSMLNDLVVGGDTVALIDWQRGGKVVLFGSDGTFLDGWTGRRSDGPPPMPIHRGANGWLADPGGGSGPPPLGPGEPWTVMGSIHLLDLASQEVGPAIYEHPVQTLYGVEGEEAGVEWALFRPRSHRAFDAEGRLFITDWQAYRIDVHDREGMVRSIRRVSELRRLTNDDVIALKDAALHVIDTMSRMPDAARPGERRRLSERIDRQARLPLPDVASPLGPILVSPDGSFWVHVVDTSSPATEEATQMFGGFGRFPVRETIWDLYDAEGAYQGNVTLPSRFRAEAVNGTVVAGVWADELDVEYVLMFEAEQVSDR